MKNYVIYITVYSDSSRKKKRVLRIFTLSNHFCILLTRCIWQPESEDIQMDVVRFTLAARTKQEGRSMVTKVGVPTELWWLLDSDTVGLPQPQNPSRSGSWALDKTLFRKGHLKRNNEGLPTCGTHQFSAGWWLSLPLWKTWTSIGMMKFPIYGEIKHVPNHQPGQVWG